MSTHQMASPRRRYYFSTFDLLTMAVIAAIGGVLAAVVLAPLGTALTAAFGPWGTTAVTGFFQMWGIIAFLLIRKPGSGFITQVLYGVVQLIAGNPLGVAVLLGAVLQGIATEIGLAIFLYRPNLWAALLSGVLVTTEASLFYAIVVFQIPVALALTTIPLAIVCGIVLCGFLAWLIARGVAGAGLSPAPSRV